MVWHSAKVKDIATVGKRYKGTVGVQESLLGLMFVWRLARLKTDVGGEYLSAWGFFPCGRLGWRHAIGKYE